MIFPDDFSSVLGVGYNGPPSGLPNDSCTGIAGKCGCVHAEANALVKAGLDAEGGILLTTMAPCLHCAGLIINAKIRCVVWGNRYRDDGGLRLLERARVCNYTLGEYYSIMREQ